VAFEDLKVAIAMLMTQMANQPEDAHEIQESLRQKLAEMRAFGMPLPDDLVDLEKKLESGLKK